jgi:hypothetical protein
MVPCRDNAPLDLTPKTKKADESRQSLGCSEPIEPAWGFPSLMTDLHNLGLAPHCCGQAVYFKGSEAFESFGIYKISIH